MSKLSADDIGNAYYLGVTINSEIDSVKRLMRKLKSLGLSKADRKGVVRNAKS